LQKQKIGAELHIYLEEGTYHYRDGRRHPTVGEDVPGGDSCAVHENTRWQTTGIRGQSRQVHLCLLCAMAANTQGAWYLPRHSAFDDMVWPAQQRGSDTNRERSNTRVNLNHHAPSEKIHCETYTFRNSPYNYFCFGKLENSVMMGVSCPSQQQIWNKLNQLCIKIPPPTWRRLCQNFSSIENLQSRSRLSSQIHSTS